jgi:hypothetical protein
MVNTQERNIQKATIKSYNIIKTDKKCIHERSHEIHTTFDNGGNILKETHYDYNGSRTKRKQIKSKYVWKYKNGKEVEMLEYYPPNRLYRKDQSFYDKTGRLTHCKSYLKGKLFSENQFQYDQKGRKTLMIEINHELGERTVYQYTYDRKNYLRETRQYDGKGVFQCGEVYTYDKNGKKIKEEHIHDNEIVAYETHEYDDQGNLRVTKRYRSELVEMELRDCRPSKHGHEVFATSIRYECDCTGTREIPYMYEVSEYKYH